MSSGHLPKHRPRLAGTRIARRVSPSPASVCRILAVEYPATFLGNKRNPLDEYLYILLSLRTHEGGFKKAYRRFKTRFPCWHLVGNASADAISAAIEPGGLARQKASRIKGCVEFIERALGELSLRELRRWPRERAEMFLLQLPGVGLKSARCIMMYSLGFRVLPVDTHVARISTRLGWIRGGTTRQIHDRLEQIVPPRMRFLFHVCCGKSVV